MEAIWNRIETWLAANAPTVFGQLNPPATEEAIAETEGFLGITLPADVRETYLRHDGETGRAGGLFGGWELLTLEGVRREWTVWKQLLDSGTFDEAQSDADGKVVAADWWNPGWIPITASGGGDNHCLDMAPGPRGRVGQVIEMWHDDGPRPVCASSFREWLSDFANELETGDYVFAEEYGGLIHRRFR